MYTVLFGGGIEFPQEKNACSLEIWSLPHGKLQAHNEASQVCTWGTSCWAFWPDTVQDLAEQSSTIPKTPSTPVSLCPTTIFQFLKNDMFCERFTKLAATGYCLHNVVILSGCMPLSFRRHCKLSLKGSLRFFLHTDHDTTFNVVANVLTSDSILLQCIQQLPTA